MRPMRTSHAKYRLWTTRKTHPISSPVPRAEPAPAAAWPAYPLRGTRGTTRPVQFRIKLPQENKKAHIALTRATRTEVAAGLVAPARPAVSKAARASRPAAAAAYSRPLDMLLYPNKTATQSPHETLVRCAQGWRLRLASSWCRKSSAPASSSTRRQLSLILAAPTRFHSVLRLRRSRERHARGYAMRRSGSRR